MTHKAIGRLAVLALTGTFLLAAAPAFAACSSDDCTEGGRPVISKHTKKIRVAHRHHHDEEDTVANRDRRDTAKSQAKVEAKPDTKSDALPSDIADARAQMTSDDGKSKPAMEASAQATADTAAAATPDPAVQVVNADELNDLDKAATDVAGLPKLPPSVANSRAEMRDDRPSTWTQASTIGKAFIAFGVMLTLASAARMFMA